ncbi:TetR/AcrR family transcriptional regulator [Paracidobacterium acidisoli]|uniref:TetR/AcrR family transcriptional regulator n=1 Tax=Paracidobacterium acidisoli TaxID=2303751 RepID=A0A372IRM6_9BACT|nr:TetR/AcrR family transcriptional regulator [Paracidobacterium acidisoli]MBT9330438.1 TetR/AcrR family transcriptional regulator [Paracidobacterium acidisoli]
MKSVKKRHTLSDRGEATRQKIIERAAPVFNRHGYAGTALSELMEVTGLQKGGIYRHFSGKEELACEAFLFAWKRATAPRMEGLCETDGAVDRLRLLVRNFVHRVPPLPGGCPLMNTAVDADDTNPALLQLARKAFRDWRALLMKIVREGQRQGEMRRDLSPGSVADLLIGSLEGALLIGRIEGNRNALCSAQKHLDGWIQSLACRAGVRKLSQKRKAA